MSVRRQQRTTWLALGLAATLVLGACSGDDDAAPDTTVATESTESIASTEAPAQEPGLVYGFLRPAPGLLSQFIAAQEQALVLAVDDINAAGGVNGAPVGIVYADEAADGDVTAAIASLAEQGASVVLGPIGSTSALAALPALSANGLVACSASATAAQLSTADTAGVMYRTAMTDAYSITHVADVIEAEAAGKEGYNVVIAARTDDYGITLSTGLASVLAARGVAAQIVGYHPRRVVFESEAKQIAALQPESVVLVSYGESVRLIDSLVAAGLPAASLLGLDGLMNPRLAEEAFPDDPTRMDGLRVIGATGDVSFLQRLADVQAQPQFVYGAQAYDCAMTMALAATASGSITATGLAPQLIPVTSDGLACSTYADCIAKLDAGEDIDYAGASGGVHFDANGDATEVRFTTAVFADGAIEAVSSVDFDVNDIRQQEALAGAVFVARLQQVLTALGFYTGPIDGVYSGEVVAAVGALQASLGLPVTGVYDAATDAALRAKYGDYVDGLSESIISLQVLLLQLGYYNGPIDGVYGPGTTAAVKALQADLGVPQTGIVDNATIQAAYQQGLIVPPTPSTTVPPTTVAPETTVAPGTTVAPTVPPTTPPPATTVPETVPPTIAPPTTVLPPIDPDQPTILETLAADPERFSILLEVLATAGFVDDADVLGPITLFAPTNAAFEALDPDQLKTVLETPELLLSWLSYHLTEGAFTLEQLAELTELESAHGEFHTITLDETVTPFVVLVDGVPTIAPELPARNGVIIPVEAVLRPQVNPLLR